MKEILTNPIVVQLELSLVHDILNIINNATHGYSQEIVDAVKNKINAAKDANTLSV